MQLFYVVVIIFAFILRKLVYLGYLYCLFKFVHCYWFMLVYFSIIRVCKTIFYFIDQ
jgi:hypothetical protein